MSRERLDYLTRVLISGVCAVFLLYVAWQVFDRFRTVFVLIGCAALLAYAISPLVNRLNRFMWRPAAVLLAYTGIAGVLLGGGYLLFGPVVRQLSDAVAHLPAQNALIQQRLVDADRVLAEHGLVVHLASSQSKIVSTLQAQGGDLLSRTLAIASSIANLLLDALVCLFMSIYMVLDGHRIHDQAMRLVPQKYRERVFFVEAAINTVVGGYVRGQLTLELTIGLLAGVGCWWMGLPYPALLGIGAAILELVPMLGPMLASIPPLALALASHDPWSLAPKVLIYFFIIQQFETNVLSPRITGHAVGLHPLGAMIALLIGANLGGPLGAIVAAPTAGLLYVLAAATYWHMTGQKVPQQRQTGWTRAGRSLRRPRKLEPTAPVTIVQGLDSAPSQVRAVEQARDQLIARFEKNQPAEESAPPLEEQGKNKGTGT